MYAEKVGRTIRLYLKQKMTENCPLKARAIKGSEGAGWIPRTHELIQVVFVE